MNIMWMSDKTKTMQRYFVGPISAEFGKKLTYGKNASSAE